MDVVACRTIIWSNKITNNLKKSHPSYDIRYCEVKRMSNNKLFNSQTLRYKQSGDMLFTTKVTIKNVQNLDINEAISIADIYLSNNWNKNSCRALGISLMTSSFFLSFSLCNEFPSFHWIRKIGVLVHLFNQDFSRARILLSNFCIYKSFARFNLYENARDTLVRRIFLKICVQYQEVWIIKI